MDGNNIINVDDYVCGAACETFSHIVKGCLIYNFSQTQEIFHTCVCKNGGYHRSITPCVQCVNGNSSALAMSFQAGMFQKLCPTIGDDCSVACHAYASVIASCAVTTIVDEECVCKYTTRKDFDTCSPCTGTGGNAVNFQKLCLAKWGDGKEAASTNGTSTKSRNSTTTETSGSRARTIIEPVATGAIVLASFGMVI